MSHTPGPWKSFETAVGTYAVNPASGGLLVCELRTLNPFSPEAAANARLIAAAPDLLAALQSLIDGGHDPDCDTQAIGDVCNCNAGMKYEAARAAIAKATGKGARR